MWPWILVALASPPLELAEVIEHGEPVAEEALVGSWKVVTVMMVEGTNGRTSEALGGVELVTFDTGGGLTFGEQSGTWSLSSDRKSLALDLTPPLTVAARVHGNIMQWHAAEEGKHLFVLFRHVPTRNLSPTFYAADVLVWRKRTPVPNPMPARKRERTICAAVVNLNLEGKVERVDVSDCEDPYRSATARHLLKWEAWPVYVEGVPRRIAVETDVWFH